MSKEKTTKEKTVKQKKPFNKKKVKKIVKRVIFGLLIVFIALFILIKINIPAVNNVLMKIPVLKNFVAGSAENGEVQLTTYTVSTRSITQMLSSTGTIEPNDKYSVTALVSGDILLDYFQEGDTVVEDQLLYNIDAESMDSNITRAENTLKDANKSLEDALENQEKLDVESDYSGIIKKIYVEIGDEINAGTLIADVIDDETMCIDIPFMSSDIPSIKVGNVAQITFTTYETAVGVVTEINPVKKLNNLGVSVQDVTISVNNTSSITTTTRAYAQIGEFYCTSDAAFYYNDEGKIYSEIGGEVMTLHFDEGDRIREGQFIAKLYSEDLEDQLENLRDRVEEAEDSLEDANDAYDNYNIKAPITGKVMAKNYKAGDTLSSGGSMGAASLAEIYDMTALKFTMNIDELDIDKISKGQEVIVTCDSRQGLRYYGKVTNISIQATTTNGTSTYPVEVVIENIEDESLRTVDEDGTINKTYKTGMTSTEKTYSLISAQTSGTDVIYTYSDEVIITRKAGDDGEYSLYDGENKLNSYINGTYTQGSSFYKFAGDFSSLTLEIENDKQMLRPGMNIDAEILVENRQNVIAVPLSAVGRGNVVKVIRGGSANAAQNDNTSNASQQQTMPEFNGEIPEFNGEMPEFNGEMPEFNGEMPEFNGQENAVQTPGKSSSRDSYGTADPNTEYEEVRVTVGINDGEYVEILSGLEVGDIIIVETNQSSSNAFDFMATGMNHSQMFMGGGMGGGMGGMGGMPSGGPPSGMGGGFRG